MILNNDSGNFRLKNKHVEMIGLGIAMTSRAVTAFFDKEIRESKLTISQIYCLYAVNKCAGQSITDIAKKLYMDRSTMSRKISGMKEFITLKKQDDKRYFYPELTEAGLAVLEKWMPRVLELERGIGALVRDKEAFVDFIHSFSAEMANRALEGLQDKSIENNGNGQACVAAAMDSDFDTRACGL